MKYFILPIALAGLLLSSCSGDAENKTSTSQEPELTAAVTVATNPYEINFSPLPPGDVNATDDTSLVKFAWEEFFALNWKASYDQDGLRDNPSNNWTYGDPDPELVVWETYAHRTELRPYDDQMQPFNNPPHYSFGVDLKPTPGSDASFDLFNNLDENNEIGSCDVYAFAGLNEPHNKENMVMYQAKVNAMEYNYVLNNYPTKAKLLAATTKTLANINAYNAYYQGATGTCNCPPADSVVCLPCGNAQQQGAMEVKTAWRRLEPWEDRSKFFLRSVIYYEEVGGQYYYNNDTFALIGIHIIHKTETFQDFVFATWEHVDVRQDTMAYVELDASGNETGPLVVNYPRLHDIPSWVDDATDSVHAQLAGMNPNSVWLNYRLVGVQSDPTIDSTGFSFYLANYVIESDSTLANFHGSSIGSPHDLGNNVLLNGQYFSMGGCQGCHGVAQITGGTDFSFLLDTVGKPVKQPDIYDEFSAEEMGKMARYIISTGGNQ